MNTVTVSLHVIAHSSPVPPGHATVTSPVTVAEPRKRRGNRRNNAGDAMTASPPHGHLTVPGTRAGVTVTL
jgi:hypothetical protein